MRTEQIEDAWENAIADTVHNLEQDLEDIIREAVIEYIEQYYEIPSQWQDQILDIKSDFDNQVIDELIQNLKLKKNESKR